MTSDQMDLFAAADEEAPASVPFRIGSGGMMLPPWGGEDPDPYVELTLHLDPPDEFLPHIDPRRPRVTYRDPDGWTITPGTDTDWAAKVQAYFDTHYLNPHDPRTLKPLVVKRDDDHMGYGGALGYGWETISNFHGSQLRHQDLIEHSEENLARIQRMHDEVRARSLDQAAALV